MKLIRFGENGNEVPGLLLPDGSRIDASAFGEDYNEKFFANDGLNRLQSWADVTADKAPKVPEDVRWAAPVDRPSKIVCIGLNYYDHAKESGMEAPDEPVIFFKATSSYSGPYDNIVIPRNGTKVDYEVELGVIIDKEAKYIESANAMDYVAGFMLFNDYSERSFQLENQWSMGQGKKLRHLLAHGPVSGHERRN